jgi:hypothetical protein
LTPPWVSRVAEAGQPQGEAVLASAGIWIGSPIARRSGSVFGFASTSARRSTPTEEAIVLSVSPGRTVQVTVVPRATEPDAGAAWMAGASTAGKPSSAATGPTPAVSTQPGSPVNN